MAAWTTYDTVGQAEDVADVIYNISPTKTPFQSMIGRDKASARMVEWQEDSLSAAAANSAVEGADASEDTLAATTMRQNYTQIIQGSIKISGTSDAVRTYGRKRETAYQMAKRAAELKRDLEFVLVGDAQNATVGDASSTARLMGNVWGQDVATNALLDSGGVDLNGGASRPLTESLVLAVHQTLFEEGGEPECLMIKPADATIVANFAAAVGRERDFGATKKVVNVVDLYVSPFGELKVVINRFMNTAYALLFDPSMWKLSVLRPWKRYPLAKVGDSERHQLLMEGTLKHNNFKASGAVGDLS